MTNPPIPERGSALTADWMGRALIAGGASDLPAITDMEVEDIGAGAGALSEILRCTMRYEDDGPGAPESVVVKLCSSDSLRRTFRSVCPHSSTVIGTRLAIASSWSSRICGAWR